MKTTSSNWKKGVIIIAVLLVPATTWWTSWRHHAAIQQTEKLSDDKKWGQSAKERRDLFVRKIMDGETIEATEVRVLNSWNGPTDPDSVWHAQRERANRTLMQHGLPALDGRMPPPDTAPLSRSVPGLKGQK